MMILMTRSLNCSCAFLELCGCDIVICVYPCTLYAVCRYLNMRLFDVGSIVRCFHHVRFFLRKYRDKLVTKYSDVVAVLPGFATQFF